MHKSQRPSYHVARGVTSSFGRCALSVCTTRACGRTAWEDSSTPSSTPSGKRASGGLCLRSGYYPAFFYPKIGRLAKNFLPGFDQAYYIHNFKGAKGGVLFRAYPGPWQVRVEPPTSPPPACCWWGGVGCGTNADGARAMTLRWSTTCGFGHTGVDTQEY